MPEWCTGIAVLVHWVAIAMFFVAAVGFVLFCVCVCVCMWMVQEAVVRDKEDWVNKVAAEGEAAKKDGQVR